MDEEKHKATIEEIIPSDKDYVKKKLLTLLNKNVDAMIVIYWENGKGNLIRSGGVSTAQAVAELELIKHELLHELTDEGE